MLSSWKESISHLVFDALKLGESSNDLPKVTGIINFDKIVESISKPRDGKNGDISSNVAFLLSKKIKSKKIKISYSKKLKGEPDKLIANGRLANKILGWSPKVKIEKSITDMILWEKYKLKNKKKFIN